MASFAEKDGRALRTPSDYIDAKAILAGVAERVTIPTGYNMVFISPTNNVFVKCGNSSITATVPGDTSDGTSSELNPSGYFLDGTHTHISLISPEDTIVTLAYYKHKVT